MPFNVQNAQKLLDEFCLQNLFIEELNWSQPKLLPRDLEMDGKT